MTDQHSLAGDSTESDVVASVIRDPQPPVLDDRPLRLDSQRLRLDPRPLATAISSFT